MCCAAPVLEHTLRRDTDPQCHLFAKWGRKYGGDETERWIYKDGQYVDQHEQTCHFEDIMAQLLQRSSEGMIMLQPMLENHATLRQGHDRAVPERARTAAAVAFFDKR